MTGLGPGPLLLCWQQPPEGPGALCWQLPPLPPTLGGLPTSTVQDKVHSTPEHSQGMRVPEGASCQCVLVPHILPDVGLVEHHDGQRVDLPALLCGLGSHPKALGDEEEVREVAHLVPPCNPGRGRPLTSGTSAMEYTTTPWYCAVFSVMRPRPDFSTWLP